MNPHTVRLVVSLVLVVWFLALLGWAFWLRWRAATAIDRDPYKARRPWSLHRPSGSVPLGRVTYHEALEMAGKMKAQVTFVDLENGFIFADTHLSTGDPAQVP